MIEEAILAGMFQNAEYCRNVIPYLKEDYFDDFHSKKIFAEIYNYLNQYKDIPSVDALKIALDNRRDMSESHYEEANKLLDELKQRDPVKNVQWLVDETEKFCQEKAIYNSIRESIAILDGTNSKLDKGAIPQMLQDALGISFDTRVGHDYFEDADERYEYYHRKEARLQFDIELLNEVTNGGLPPKSLTVFAATTGVGKSLTMCHMAANHLMYGKKVLYITMELAEEEVSRRIDANILDTKIGDIENLPEDVFKKRISRYKNKSTGKLIVKEYPTGGANAAHFRHLLNELRIKKNFEPDVIYIDYLNICSSARIRGGGDANSYMLIKSIAEELRGLAVEFAVPVVTATQLNRGAYGSTDVDLDNTSESMGLPATADAFFALITSEELESLGQVMIKQLKNRWGDLGRHRRFVIGIERAKMKLFDLESGAQTSIANATPDSAPRPRTQNSVSHDAPPTYKKPKSDYTKAKKKVAGLS